MQKIDIKNTAIVKFLLVLLIVQGVRNLEIYVVGKKQVKTIKLKRLKARLQPFTVLFSFSAILVCFIDAQIVDLSVNKTN